MLDNTRGETVSQAGNGEPGTKEAEALAAAVNHSAERVQTLWFSFLTFMVYLAIATGTTTHRMLFLEEPLNLPVLNIKLPLLGFYILTPIIFVVFHFYMLLNLVLLARTAKSFEDALARAFPEDGEPRENFRMRIENTLFIQLLVGGRLEREGINGKLLSWMALITLALAPGALLLMFEVKFLPYHSWPITWLHRCLLTLDLALVWTLWPGYRSGWGVLSWPMRSWRLALPGVLSATALSYVVLVATFPDERVYLATDLLHGSWAGDKISPVNTLDLHGEDLIDDTKLAHILEKKEDSAGAERWVATLSVAGRDLTDANLRSADVRHVDFSHAILNRANLESAWATKARFDGAHLQGALLREAQLQGASLAFTHLQGASLDHARLQGALLGSAQLRGASLNDAQLQSAYINGAQLKGAHLMGAWLVSAHLMGAWLDGAQLQGSSLDRAQLQGASLNDAQLQGASLNDTQLQGASLNDTQLQGASLNGAQLQGASLNDAQLQGGSLNGAHLQGASLDEAQLQGALLDHAQLQGASFVDACVWRADARQAVWTDTRVKLPKADKIHKCDWTAASFETLKQLIAAEVPKGANKRSVMDMIEQRLDPTKPLEGKDEMSKIWTARESESPTPWVYAKNLAGQWRELGCAAEGGPYVLHNLIARLRNFYTSPFHDQSVAAAFLDETHCPGAHGLSEDDKAELKRIAAPAAPQAPKP